MPEAPSMRAPAAARRCSAVAGALVSPTVIAAHRATASAGRERWDVVFTLRT